MTKLYKLRLLNAKKIAKIISVPYQLGLHLFLQYEDLICLYFTALYTFISLLNATVPSKWRLGDVTHNKRTWQRHVLICTLTATDVLIANGMEVEILNMNKGVSENKMLWGLDFMLYIRILATQDYNTCGRASLCNWWWLFIVGSLMCGFPSPFFE